jgi:hypothetical protein
LPTRAGASGINRPSRRPHRLRLALETRVCALEIKPWRACDRALTGAGRAERWDGFDYLPCTRSGTRRAGPRGRRVAARADVAAARTQANLNARVGRRPERLRRVRDAARGASLAVLRAWVVPLVGLAVCVAAVCCPRSVTQVVGAQHASLRTIPNAIAIAIHVIIADRTLVAVRRCLRVGDGRVGVARAEQRARRARQLVTVRAS